VPPRRRSGSGAASVARPVRMAARDNSAFALRQLVDELAAQLRSGVEKIGDLPQETGERLARELGLVRREELESVELRLAQLEHRLKLLEKQP
jgi:polyhydroxyalkanoate synthesis regulator phasin